jgi:dynein heavy chain 2, cytosolic
MSTGISALPTHTLLASGYITYLGSAPEDTRTQMLDEWKNMCKLPEWTFTKFMSTESEMLTLKAEGLPADGIFN